LHGDVQRRRGLCQCMSGPESRHQLLQRADEELLRIRRKSVSHTRWRGQQRRDVPVIVAVVASFTRRVFIRFNSNHIKTVAGFWPRKHASATFGA
jgi:hypothetical protein